MTHRRFVRGGWALLMCLLVVAGFAAVMVAQGGGQAGPTDPQQRLKWFEQHLAMEAQSPSRI